MSVKPIIAALVVMLLIGITGRWQAQNDEPVVLQLKWEHEFQFAGYYAALWQGFYQENGLNVDVRSAFSQDGEFLSPLEELLAGRAEFAIGGLDAIIGRWSW